MSSTRNHSTFGEILVKYFGLKLIFVGLAGFGYRTAEFPEDRTMWGSLTAIFTLLGIAVLLLARFLKKYRLNKGTAFNRWERFLDTMGPAIFFLSVAAQVPIGMNVRLDIVPWVSLGCYIGGCMASTLFVIWVTRTNVKRQQRTIAVEAMLSSATADQKRKPA
ncbi:MAG TPA: hypothetical protein VLK22_02505 [Candidatus Udaeobacter sp.]|nr:hypothetical protein [Candidatus Udaeobacter sp.]